MNHWDHLPNAKHIDRVLASVTANPELWSAAWDAAWVAARLANQGLAWDVAWRAVMSAAREAAREAAWEAERQVAWEAERQVATWEAARNAMLALIAYDDCSHMLDSDVGELKILAAFRDTRAILLLPACIAFAKEKELV